MLIFLCALIAIEAVTNLLLVLFLRDLRSAKKRTQTYASKLEESLNEALKAKCELDKELEAKQWELNAAHMMLETVLARVPEEKS